jgi:uncharacterized membrane protein YraQ (UPF0718 family)
VDYETFLVDFTAILYEAMPFIVLGVVIAGVLEEFVPQRFITRIIPRSRPVAIAIGGLLGLIFPMCECGIIPVMRRLLRKGVPLSVCITYMLAGPIINVVVILSTAVAFSAPGNTMFGAWWMAVLARVGGGFLVAFSTGMLIERMHRRLGDGALIRDNVMPSAKSIEEEGESRKEGLLKRLTNISETALHDFVDIMVFLILGAFLASGVRYILPFTNIQDYMHASPPISIAVMMLLAILLCLCSEADAFVAAGFGGLVPDAAKFAFLVLGPMLDLKLYVMFTRVFKLRLIRTIIIALIIQVYLLALAAHYIWDPWGKSWMGVPASQPTSAANR